MLTDKDIKKIDILLSKRIGEEIGQSEKRMAGVIENEIDQSEKRIAGNFSKTLRHELDPMKKDIMKIRKDLKTTINFFDREYLDLRERVEVIERRLNIGL